ncbi:hypothetical protein N7462_003538 [Penicillium macrosclerotiorum]|uniref:uncharacterized protein n=1 Tax=Penicillium macrosclerotiorum TaxID=303699 RepID=UPI00254956D3|nr:uncharacterized protein N7462_003538 [Penicillium macrosclerotiorum]KAJ5689146.1 hypothetical protein N7462_003538 [Penicillium macrosclerotiorum]
MLFTNPVPENTTSSIDLPSLNNLGLIDDAVKKYKTWQQWRLGDEALKAEAQEACDVALDDGLDLVQIGEDKNPDYQYFRYLVL